MKDTALNTVQHDSGWVRDGHILCWDGRGTWLIHTSECPCQHDADGLREHLCSPGVQEDNFGIFLNDLPADQFTRCFDRPNGAEPIQWRLREVFHPDMDDAQVAAVAIFEIKLDEEDVRND